MLPAIFPEKDCKLILRHCAEYPDLWDHLTSFLWLDPEYRPRQAVRLLKTLIRQEWLAYGLEEREIDNLFAFKRKMINLDRKLRSETLDPLKTKLRIWVYDMPTALLGSNRANEAIDVEDFTRLQTIAGDIIFSAPQYKENRSALESLLNHDTPEDRWVRDLERLLFLKHLATKPEIVGGYSFDEHWEKMRPEWQSMEAMMLSYDLRYHDPCKTPRGAHEIQASRPLDRP